MMKPEALPGWQEEETEMTAREKALEIDQSELDELRHDMKNHTVWYLKHKKLVYQLIEHAEAALTSESGAGEWMDISSAPMDEWILICRTGSRPFTDKAMKDRGVWRTMIGGIYDHPTHWMPLPKTPTEG